MIDAKDAARIAVEYYRAIAGKDVSLVVEELEATEEDKFWMVKVSVTDPLQQVTMRFTSTSSAYKIIRIAAADGRVVAMKNA
jgi:hypothetical protein